MERARALRRTSIFRQTIGMRILATLLIATSAFAQQKPLERLQTNIEKLTQSYNAKWGIYIKCLETGEEIAIHADDTFDTMSVIKIPLMVESFRQIEAG